jgi:hypothetical protein
MRNSQTQPKTVSMRNESLSQTKTTPHINTSPVLMEEDDRVERGESRERVEQ